MRALLVLSLVLLWPRPTPQPEPVPWDGVGSASPVDVGAAFRFVVADDAVTIAAPVVNRTSLTVIITGTLSVALSDGAPVAVPVTLDSARIPPFGQTFMRGRFETDRPLDDWLATARVRVLSATDVPFAPLPWPTAEIVP